MAGKITMGGGFVMLAPGLFSALFKSLLTGVFFSDLWVE